MLQLRDKELAASQQSLAEEQAVNEKLRVELELLKSKADRQQARVQLTEREVGYLKAMLVCRYLCLYERHGLMRR